MKRLFFIVCMFSFLSICSVSADESALDTSNWGVQSRPQASCDYDEYYEDGDTSPSEDTWNGEHDNKIYEKYGSEESPAFLNRENINPSESDYNSGAGIVSD